MLALFQSINHLHEEIKWSGENDTTILPCQCWPLSIFFKLPKYAERFLFSIILNLSLIQLQTNSENLKWIGNWKCINFQFCRCHLIIISRNTEKKISFLTYNQVCQWRHQLKINLFQKLLWQPTQMQKFKRFITSSWEIR